MVLKALGKNASEIKSIRDTVGYLHLKIVKGKTIYLLKKLGYSSGMVFD